MSPMFFLNSFNNKTKGKLKLKIKMPLKYIMLISFVFCVGTFLTAFLSGCDAPDNCGCGCIDPPPQVEDNRTMIPDSSWDCSMPDGISSPESGELVFETGVNGNYSYLNDGLWLSSAPKPSSGQVEITIFESIKLDKATADFEFKPDQQQEGK